MTTALYVSSEETCYHSESSDEPYGPWEESNHFSVSEVYLEQQSVSDEKITVNGNIKKGDAVYVLAMTYTTGDSFGSSSGNGEIIWVFTDPTVARRARAEYIKDENSFSVEFEDEAGNNLKLHNPAAGYFESIDDIEIYLREIR